MPFLKSKLVHSTEVAISKLYFLGQLGHHRGRILTNHPKVKGLSPAAAAGTRRVNGCDGLMGQAINGARTKCQNDIMAHFSRVCHNSALTE